MGKDHCEPSRWSRRVVLKVAGVAGAGLVLGVRFQPSRAEAVEKAAGESFAPNAFVRIGRDDTVTVMLKHIEFGQGVSTGLPTIVAEELDADWSQMRFEHAPADSERYNNLFFGPVQGTGGSTAVPNSWEQLRQAGASARAMLVEAAAGHWGVPASQVTVEGGRVRHRGSGKEASFGELVDRAAALDVPKDVKLKNPKNFKLIGKGRLPRLDVPHKVDGRARFTQDVYLPDMLTAVVAHGPLFGAVPSSFDGAEAEKVNGVVEVVQIPSGVAVVARNFWAAKKGRDALSVTWDESGAETRGSEDLLEEYRKILAEDGAEVETRGDGVAGLDGAASTLEAEFVYPFLAHAPMETLDFVIHFTGDACEAWAGSQLQTVDHGVLAGTLGLDPDKVKLHTLLGGGSFGRRATPEGEMAAEAAHIAKALGAGPPVKLIWTREDDIRGGKYRPFYVHRLRGGLDDRGKIVAWHQVIVGQSILAGTPFEQAMVQDGIDASSVEGGRNLPYAFPHLRVDLHSPKTGVTALWWRSVGHTHNAYSTEVFLDQLLREGGKDPYEGRRELMKDHPRHRAVLDLAAKKAGWGDPLPEGKARGIAVHESFSSFVAQVAEISLDGDGMPKVERVVCAVDCGIAINPDIVAAQMESGIGYGLNAVLYSEIELEGGRVKQSNFHDYRPLRIHEMPRVEVHIVPSTEAPTGVGEPGVPPIAPAVANAYLALTGKVVHRLPFSRFIQSETARSGEEVSA